MNSLELISKASQMLAEATTIQKAKELKNLALTAIDWAKRRKMGESTIQYARNYAFEAEKRMGELLKATDRANGGDAQRTRYQLGTESPPILSDLGITKRESSNAQFLASLSEEEFEKIKQDKTKTATIRRKYKQKQLREDAAKKFINEFNSPLIHYADYKDWLQTQPDYDLLLTDPPYMTDIGDIKTFANWLPRALAKVKPTGRAYIFIGAYPQELAAYLAVAMPTQILSWTYRNTLGPSPRYSYKLNWQAILYFQMPDAPSLNCPIMTEQFSVQDINAPDGRLGNKYHTWQKPDEIAERFIRHSTQEENLVCDPFAGTGTFLLAAAKLNRKALGCENNEEIIKIAEIRGCKIG